MPPIAGQSVLVVGASTGIGFEVAKLCLAEKMKVHIASSNPVKIQHAVETLKSTFPDGNVTSHVAKLGDSDTEAALEKLFAEVTADGLLDHFVTTAGRPDPRPIKDIDFSYLVKEGTLPLITNMLIGKVAPKYLKPHWTSSITFTGGQIGERPMAGWAISSGWVGGLSVLVKGFALDLKPLRCNYVSPGATNTELWGPQRHERAKAVAQRSLLGKCGMPEEVAEAFIYLMKDTNATGISIHSSGGSIIQ